MRNQLAEAEGCTYECGCCCADIAFENSVQCTDGHLFCKHCVQRYVEETVFGNGSTRVKCMNTSEECNGFFNDVMLRASLPLKVLQAYDAAVARENLKGLENIVQCFDCGLQVEMPEGSGTVLSCQECGAETCRLCGEEAHIPLRCNEVEKKSMYDAVKHVEPIYYLACVLY